MSDARALIDDFYSAFARRDGRAMADCYHPEASFTDPVFPDLGAEEVRAMWRMLCERGKDLQVEHRDAWVEGDQGGAQWDARYTFSATGRPVHNRVVASFRFADGKIIEHRDAFSFWRWSRQALGLPGALLGWTPLIRTKVRKLARAGLDEYRRNDRS